VRNAGVGGSNSAPGRRRRQSALIFRPTRPLSFTLRLAPAGFGWFVRTGQRAIRWFRLSRIFHHEELEVYRAALAFLDWLEPALQWFPSRFSWSTKLDRASTSIPLHFAEGTGKFTAADRCRCFDIGRGSALERGRIA
jgi:hypothetical protein